MKAGDIVEIDWEPGKTKRARFVRETRGASVIVQVERVDAKGQPCGVWGSDRSISRNSVLRVLEAA